MKLPSFLRMNQFVPWCATCLTRRSFLIRLAALGASPQLAGSALAQLSSASTMQTGGAKARPLVIDFHTHVLEPVVAQKSSPHSAWSISVPPPAGAPYAHIIECMLNPERQVEDMDRRGIDMHVISSATVVQGTAWADPATALELNRQVNDMIAEWVRRYPSRFIGSFTLPLQDVELSLRELERAVGDLKLKVANLPASINGAYLGERQFRPLWQALQERGVTSFIHPDGVKDPWFQKYGLWNSLGQTIEEAKFMSSVIYEGILDTYPQLKIVIAHGGGSLPHYFGRHDRNVRNMPESTVNISRKPSEYFRNFYYDTCVYVPSILDALVARVGADRIVMGGDYPVGEADPVGFVKQCRSIGETEFPQVVGGTAARLLGITV